MKREIRGRLKAALSRGIVTCLALVLAFGVSIESFAAKEGKVITEMANIRSSADAGADRVAQLPADSTFSVTEETTDGSNHVWYNIVFTLDGAQKSGWIRSDLAEITHEDVEEVVEETVEPGAPVVDGVTLMEPATLPELSDDYSEGMVWVGETGVTAWAVDTALTGGAEIFLVYGLSDYGIEGWYFYDLEEGSLQRAVGQFSGGNAAESEGLLNALRQENSDLQKANERAVAIREYIIIGLAALTVILLVVVIVLAVKLSRIDFIDDEYDDDEDEDDDEDDEDDDDRDALPSWMEQAKAKKEAARRMKEKDEFDDEFDEDEDDNFLEAFANKVAEAYKETEKEAEESKEEPEVQEKAKEKKAAQKAVEDQAKTVAPAKKEDSDDDFDDEDFDIEILDLDDLRV